MGMSSPGNAGKVGFPQYIETYHSLLIGTANGLTNLAQFVAGLQAGDSPYFGETAYNPDTALAANQTRFDIYDAAVTSFSPNSNWETAIEATREKLGESASYPKIDLVSNDIATNAIANAIAAATSVLAGSAISDQVDAYEVKATPRFLRSVNRFASGLADIGAVNSSAFIVGMALLESEFVADVNKFDADLSAQAFNAIAVDGIRATFQAAATKQQQRNVQFAEASNLLLQSLVQKIQLNADATKTQADLNSVKITTKQDETNRNLELQVADSFFDLDVLSRAVGIVGGLSGATYIPEKPSAFERGVGLVLSAGASVAALASGGKGK